MRLPTTGHSRVRHARSVRRRTWSAGRCRSSGRPGHPGRDRLVLRDGEGHLGIFEHLGEMLNTLTAPDMP